MTLDLDAIRGRFPALARTEQGEAAAYLDGPGGTQVPVDVIEAMAAVQRRGMSNLGGSFGSSRDAQEIVDDARIAAADLLGGSPAEIVFGQNMTSLTFTASRAIAQTWSPGDSVVVTMLDHDANVRPWTRAAIETGVEFRVAGFDTTSGTLVPDRVASLIDKSTRLVAVPAASNALGSVPDLTPIIAAAHAVDALVYVDAVHFAAHRLPEVTALGADFCAVSAYKFFGPHTGILFGASEHLAAIEPYKVRPSPDTPPESWETGTQSFESLAGVTAAIDYLASLGEGVARRSRLESAFSAIRSHEERLTSRFLDGIGAMPHVTLHGPGGGEGDRVATFAITLAGLAPAEAARRLASRGIQVWSGDYYAVGVMGRLGLVEAGGAVRIGFVHYTTADEVARVLEALADLG